ncbi:hypothetical protein [Nocardioides sp. AE5]|uniref:hypothetical protein n=1 Tax=Nocardioides sp. AE5 TaxID=2962573 RepID=UPI0028814253|nr:hypothetical protein [Nocardioides sp. AE5]MDT0203265.1 hypothetical protein [Nocardioides sp. AE5]
MHRPSRVLAWFSPANKPRDERGAIAIMVGVLTIVLVGVCSLAVDIGYQRVAARDMQAVADLVALDMARTLKGNTTSTLNGTDEWNAAVAASLARNDNDTVGEPLTVVTCTVAQTELTGAEICATPGIYNPIDGSFVDSGSDGATHVRVITRTKVDFFFPIFANGGWVNKTAYAESAGGACFSIGSYAAELDTGASPILGPLLTALGGNINLTAANYEGLANTNVDLLYFLGADIGAGTMSELIRGDQLVSLGDFYLLAASALRAQSGNTAEVVLLETIAPQVPGTQIPVADLLALGTGGAAGLDSDLNLLDLVTAGAALANKQAGVSLPGLQVNLGPLANVNASVNVIEAPRTYCGRSNDTEAELPQSAAARVQLSADAVNLNLGILNTRVSLSGSVQAASAKGKLEGISCAPNSVVIQVSDALLVIDLRLEVRITALAFLGAITGPILLKADSQIDPTSKELVLDSEDRYDQAFHYDNNSSGLPGITADFSQLRLLGLPLGSVLGIILTPLTDLLINPLLKSLDEVLLTPLLASLGLDISGADVFVHRYPKCDGTALRG